VTNHRAGPPRRRWPLTLVVVATAIAATVTLAPPAEPVEVNVSPMASVEVAGQAGRVVPGAGIERCLPEAMLDATVDALYLAEVLARDDGPVATITWPWPVDLRRIGILGGDDRFEGTLLVEAGPERLALRRGPRPGVPLFADRTTRVAVDRITIRWLGRPPGLASFRINAVAAMAVMPRWRAWAYVLGLGAVGPYLVGAAVVLAMLGLGRGLAPAGDLGLRMALGLIAATALAVAWIVAPRSPWADGLHLAILGVAAAWELGRGPIGRPSPDRGLFALIAAAAGLLVLDVFADTTLVMSRRMQPVDYLHSYIGAERLASRAPMVGQLLLRPWLLHAFFAPTTAALGRFGYWGYIGIMGWLNALVLVPIAAIARGWGRGDGLAPAGRLALLPILACFNAPGQRPLAAAFCLLAVAAWRDRRGLLGSLYLTVAVGVHPGSLFLIPPAAIVLLGRAGWKEAVRATAPPVAAYWAWSRAIHWAHPGLFNMLAFHPLMTDYEVTFPPEMTLLDAALSLPADYWARLLANRLRHLPQYLWAENMSEPVVDAFRWVSLASVLGVVWAASLLRPGVWRGRGEFAALAVVGPLIVHHGHIGLALSLFHVCPTPFFALALLAVTLPLPAWAGRLARAELFARRLYPLAIVVLLPSARGEPGVSRFGLLGDDRPTCIALACIAPLAWLALARRVDAIPEPSPGPVRDPRVSPESWRRLLSAHPRSPDPTAVRGPRGRPRRSSSPARYSLSWRPCRRPPPSPGRSAKATACKPPACRRCHHPLQGDDPEPLIHQVAEWPAVGPIVHEYRRHRLRRPGCSETTCGPTPRGVPAGASGPRLRATLGLPAGADRLSKRQVRRLARDLPGLRIAPGMIAELGRDSAATPEAPVGQPRASVIEAPVVHIDETSWRQGRKKSRPRVTATGRATVFTIAETRGASVARTLPGTGRPRVVIGDRFPGYDRIAVGDRQVCWAHLRRDFRAMIDRGGVSEPIGRELLDASDRLLRRWHRVRDGTLKRSDLARLAGRVRAKVETALALGERCGCGRTEGTCSELRKVEPGFWTFVKMPGVEPTNTTAERALRHAVIWRRVGGGTDSRAGGRFVERMLTAVATCRQHGRDVLDYLTSCFEARLSGRDIPSLLPN